MRIAVSFSFDVPAGSLPALRELAAAETNAEARAFIQAEAEEYVLGYMEANGVHDIERARGAW